MPFTRLDDGTVVITGDSIRVFHVMQVRSALGLEINHGGKFSNRGSLVETAARCGYTEVKPGTRATAKVKRQVYKDLDDLMVALGGSRKPLRGES